MKSLLSFSFCLLITFVIIFILTFSSFTKKRKLFILMITLLLSILAFFYNPIRAYNNGNYTDLYRFFVTMDAYRLVPFNNNVSLLQEYNNIPVMKVLIFIISRTGINNLLPFISCFLVYGIMGFIIYKISKKYDISPKVMGSSFFIFICLFNYTMVISNIRMPIGLSILFLTFYYDIFVKGKRSFYYLGYLLCCLIHPVFYIFVFLRILLLFVNKFTNKIIYFMILICSMFMGHLINILSKFTNLYFFEYIYSKLDLYFNIWNGNNYSFLVVFPAVLNLIVLCYFLFLSKKYIKKDSSEKKFYNLSLIFLLFTIGSYSNYIFFQRFSWIIIYFIIYWYMFLKSYSLSTQNNSSTKLSIPLYNLVIIGIVIVNLVLYFLTYQYNILTF